MKNKISNEQIEYQMTGKFTKIIMIEQICSKQSIFEKIYRHCLILSDRA